MAAYPVNESVSAEQIRTLLNYDPKTGLFIWLPRAAHMKSWNTRYAWTIAGTPTKPKGYIQIAINGTLFLGHRLAWVWMTGEWPAGDIDHKNCVTSDNRWKNLRVATASQNKANIRRRSDNTSGFKGVTWDKRTKSWVYQVQIGPHYERQSYFHTAEEAYTARCEAAERLHGEFARHA